MGEGNTKRSQLRTGQSLTLTQNVHSILSEEVQKNTKKHSVLQTEKQSIRCISATVTRTLCNKTMKPYMGHKNHMMAQFSKIKRNLLQLFVCLFVCLFIFLVETYLVMKPDVKRHEAIYRHTQEPFLKKIADSKTSGLQSLR